MLRRSSPTDVPAPVRLRPSHMLCPMRTVQDELLPGRGVQVLRMPGVFLMQERGLLRVQRNYLRVRNQMLLPRGLLLRN